MILRCSFSNRLLICSLSFIIYHILKLCDNLIQLFHCIQINIYRLTWLLCINELCKSCSVISWINNLFFKICLLGFQAFIVLILLVLLCLIILVVIIILIIIILIIVILIVIILIIIIVLVVILVVILIIAIPSISSVSLPVRIVVLI